MNRHYFTPHSAVVAMSLGLHILHKLSMQIAVAAVAAGGPMLCSRLVRFGASTASGHHQIIMRISHGIFFHIIVPFWQHWTKLTNPTVHLSHIPQCTIQNINVHISVLNGALWDIGQLHCGICEIDLLTSFLSLCHSEFSYWNQMSSQLFGR